MPRTKDAVAPELPVAAPERTRVNPFINRTPELTPLKRVLFFFTGITLLPIRMVLIIIDLLLIWFFAALATAGLSRQYLETHPLPAWRCALRMPMWLLMRLFLFLLGFHWLEVEGAPAPRERAPVVIANHTSFVDPTILMLACAGTPVSRAENEKIPLIGSILRALQTIFVERTGSRAGRTAVKEKIRERACNNAMPPVLIFPEATCTNGQAVISFKVGAFVPMRAVQIVAITYPDAATSFDPAWVTGGPNLLGLVVGLMLRPHNRIRVRYLPPMDPPPPPEGCERGSSLHAEAFAREAQLTLSRVIGSPATRHSFLDVILAERAAKLKHKKAGHLVPEFSAMGDVMDLDIDEAKSVLETFVAADTDRDGRISRDEWIALFARTKGSAPAPAGLEEQLGALFDMLDQSDTDSLEFRDFLLGMALLQGKSKGGLGHTLRAVFRALTAGQKKDPPTLDRDAFERLARSAFPDRDPKRSHTAFDEARGAAPAVDEEAFVRYYEGKGDIVSKYREALLGVKDL